jgi:hypothetical protein
MHRYGESLLRSRSRIIFIAETGAGAALKCLNCLILLYISHRKVAGAVTA